MLSLIERDRLFKYRAKLTFLKGAELSESKWSSVHAFRQSQHQRLVWSIQLSYLNPHYHAISIF